jgi:hypothetical protein
MDSTEYILGFVREGSSLKVFLNCQIAFNISQSIRMGSSKSKSNTSGASRSESDRYQELMVNPTM